MNSKHKIYTLKGKHLYNYYTVQTSQKLNSTRMGHVPAMHITCTTRKDMQGWFTCVTMRVPVMYPFSKH